MATVSNTGRQLTKEDLVAMVAFAKETGSLPVGRKLRIIEDPALRAEFISGLRSALSGAEAERVRSGESSKSANDISRNLKRVLDEFEGYDAYIRSRNEGHA